MAELTPGETGERLDAYDTVIRQPEDEQHMGRLNDGENREQETGTNWRYG